MKSKQSDLKQGNSKGRGQAGRQIALEKAGKTTWLVCAKPFLQPLVWRWGSGKELGEGRGKRKKDGGREHSTEQSWGAQPQKKQGSHLLDPCRRDRPAQLADQVAKMTEKPAVHKLQNRQGLY